jgi:chromosome segregation ATPase
LSKDQNSRASSPSSLTEISNIPNFIQNQSSQVRELQQTNQELATLNSQSLNKIKHHESEANQYKTHYISKTLYDKQNEELQTLKTQNQDILQEIQETKRALINKENDNEELISQIQFYQNHSNQQFQFNQELEKIQSDHQNDISKIIKQSENQMKVLQDENKSLKQQIESLKKLNDNLNFQIITNQTKMNL